MDISSIHLDKVAPIQSFGLTQKSLSVFALLLHALLSPVLAQLGTSWVAAASSLLALHGAQGGHQPRSYPWVEILASLAIQAAPFSDQMAVQRLGGLRSQVKGARGRDDSVKIPRWPRWRSAVSEPILVPKSVNPG